MSLAKKYAADNPANRVRPGVRFAFSHPAYMIALFFGAGCIRPAPGTWGTLAGLIVWILMVQWMPWQALAACVVALFIVGALASQKTCDDLGVDDAGCVVIDEVVAIWLVCLMLPQTPVAWCAAFVAFRLFDIVKLPPATYVDEKMHNGWGIMLDDVFAAVWAVWTVIVIDMAVNRFTDWTFLGVF